MTLGMVDTTCFGSVTSFGLESLLVVAHWLLVGNMGIESCPPPSGGLPGFLTLCFLTLFNMMSNTQEYYTVFLMNNQYKVDLGEAARRVGFT